MARSMIELFNAVGGEFETLFSEPGIALYAIYTVVFFMALFTLIRAALERVPHLRGKPATVISIAVSVISIGGLFYNKSASEAIAMFSSFGGFILMLIFCAAIIGLSVYWGNKVEKKLTKTLIISWGIFIGTSIVLPVFIEYFELTSGGKFSGGAAGVILAVFEYVNMISLIVAFITTLMFGFGLIKGGFSGITTGFTGFGKNADSPEKQNRDAGKSLLRGLVDDSRNSEDVMAKLNKNVETLVNGNSGASGGQGNVPNATAQYGGGNP
ncbi:MAG: hypothetical protein KC589_02105 [Nanoarchaeota archaeon]|nr:hypothetical protein [Nanoarchaeota archaeon]